jgi:hypothetical protein
VHHRIGVRWPYASLAGFGLAFAAAPRDYNLLARSLGLFPLLDRCPIKAPITAYAKARKQALAQQTIDGRRMDAQVFGQFLNREYIVLGRHSDVYLIALYLLNA